MRKYDFLRLGTANFQSMVQTLIKEIIGAGVTSMDLIGKDGARDAYYSGKAELYPSKEECWDGTWIFQVKYHDYEKFGGIKTIRRKILNDLKNEVKSLTKYHQPFDNYIFITNVPLSGETDKGTLDKIYKYINESFPGVKFAIWHYPDLCNFLDMHSEIKMAFPQILGIEDIQYIIGTVLTKSTSERTEAFIEGMHEIARRFVSVSAYYAALNILGKYHFVVLKGPPKMGKTTIAKMIGLVYYRTKEFEIRNIQSPKELYNAYEKNSQQIFICDDVFGDIGFVEDFAIQWSKEFPNIFHKLNKHHKLVWTGRTHIVNTALKETKLGEDYSEELNYSSVVVEVNKMSLMEKALILYNHAKISSLSETEKEIVKEDAYKISTHKNFSPELVRQIFWIYIENQK